MRRALPVLLAAALVAGCAGRKDDAAEVQSMDDPQFVAWYKTATPYMRTAFFISLCAAQELAGGSIEINFCVSNLRKQARVKVEGAL